MTRDAQLVVASYNVHGFVGTDGQFNLQRIVDVLDDVGADVIALQEVEHRSVSGVPVAERLSELLDMHAVRGDTFRRAGHDYGNLVLTRARPTAVARHDLSVTRREPRGAIDVVLRADGVDWRIIATHLGLSLRERRIQFGRLGEIVAEADSSRATVLAGDFNEWRPFAPLLRRIGGDFEVVRSPRTFPSRRPSIALDRIVARPRGALHRIRRIDGPTARIASDHLPIVATLVQPGGS